MKKLFKVVAIVVGIFVLLLIAAAVIVPLADPRTNDRFSLAFVDHTARTAA